MSWWTNLRDGYITFQTAGLYNPRESRRTEADARYAINGQIKAYKEQTELTRKEIDRVKNEEAVEKRRVNEKQIRSLRHNYRSSGMLGGGDASQADMSQNLGG